MFVIVHLAVLNRKVLQVKMNVLNMQDKFIWPTVNEFTFY